MKKEKKLQLKNVLIYIVVFLCVLTAAFFLLRSGQGGWRLPWLPEEQPSADSDSLTEQNLSPAEREFIKKNREEVEALRRVAAELEEMVPELGVTSRQFNEGLLPLIELLQELGAEAEPENWPEFQTRFAYECEKLNRLRQSQTNLPKQVQDSEDKIMQILQKLNQIIQRMNK